MCHCIGCALHKGILLAAEGAIFLFLLVQKCSLLSKHS